MSDIQNDELISEPFADLPDNIIGSILGNYGFASPEGGEGDPTDTAPETAPPAAPGPSSDEEPVEVPTPPGGPLYSETEEVEGEAEPGASDSQPAVPAPPAAAQTDPIAAAVAARAETDPAFRQQLAQLLFPTQPTGTAIQPTGQPLPQFTDDDLENPALRALLMVASEQQKRLTALQESFDKTQQDIQARTQREIQQAADVASANFASTYNLPPGLIAEIRPAAANHIHAAAAQTPADPLTGEPNMMKVLEKALEIAYWASPTARQFEYQRQDTARQAAVSRKQKLGGISGSSGSAPRQPAPFDLNTETGRHQAAVAEVTQAMFGTEQ